MTAEEEQSLDRFLTAVREQDEYTLNSIDRDALDRAAKLIEKSKSEGGRLHVTGIGKPGHLAEYIASLIASTGTPTYFLHGTEAVHGSSGQLVEGDVVIGISNSGNTEELIATINCVKSNGCKVIGVTGDPDSKLAALSDVCLLASVVQEEDTETGKKFPVEGGPLNRAPRNSILAEMLVLQALSVVLQRNANVTPEQYVKHHPHGALGKLRDNERQAM